MVKWRRFSSSSTSEMLVPSSGEGARRGSLARFLDLAPTRRARPLDGDESKDPRANEAAHDAQQLVELGGAHAE